MWKAFHQTIITHKSEASEYCVGQFSLQSMTLSNVPSIKKLFHLCATDDSNDREESNNEFLISCKSFSLDPDSIKRNDRFDKSTCLLINFLRCPLPPIEVDLLPAGFDRCRQKTLKLKLQKIVIYSKLFSLLVSHFYNEVPRYDWQWKSILDSRASSLKIALHCYLIQITRWMIFKCGSIELSESD